MREVHRGKEVYILPRKVELSMLNGGFVNSPKCGEIWMRNLPATNGSIQNGYRPVFILSNNQNNTYSTTINIIPLTTKMNKRRLPIHVELWSYKDYGLKAPSTMLIEQIMTISNDSLDRCIGAITDSYILSNVRKAISIQFPVMQMVS